MEDNRKLVRMFDRVKLSPEREEAMLADLLTDKKEVSGMKQNRRKFPAAALAAAVLVIALAGTALAVEYFGKINIELLDGFPGEQGEWYGAHMSEGRVPVSCLSDELLAAYASADEAGDLYIPFGSRQDVEAFLGFELADNARLEQMPVKNTTHHFDGQSGTQTPCSVGVTYNSEQIPVVVSMCVHYDEGSHMLVEYIQFGTDAAPETFAPGGYAPIRGEGDFQEYVTPNGIEVATVRDDGRYNACFAKDNVCYSIIFGSDNWDTLKEILDAYE